MIELELGASPWSPAIAEAIDAAGIDLGLAAGPAPECKPTSAGGDSAS